MKLDYWAMDILIHLLILYITLSSQNISELIAFKICSKIYNEFSRYGSPV